MLTGDCEELKISVEGITADGMEIRGLALEVEPEDLSELLQPFVKILTDEELLLEDEQRKWFPEIKPTSGEDAMKIIIMTSIHCTLHRLQYSINITLICTGKAINLCHLLYCDICLLRWPGTKPTTSLRYACPLKILTASM